jgi:hypothetical protein
MDARLTEDNPIGLWREQPEQLFLRVAGSHPHHSGYHTLKYLFYCIVKHYLVFKRIGECRPRRWGRSEEGADDAGAVGDIEREWNPSRDWRRAMKPMKE